MPLRVIPLIKQLEHLVASRVEADDYLSELDCPSDSLLLFPMTQYHQEVNPLVAVLVPRDVQLDPNLGHQVGIPFQQAHC